MSYALDNPVFVIALAVLVTVTYGVLVISEIRWSLRIERRCKQYADELGPGTCHADETDTIECVCDGIGHYGKRLTVHVMECSECGRTYEHVWGAYEYCPHCGRKVVDE